MDDEYVERRGRKKTKLAAPIPAEARAPRKDYRFCPVEYIEEVLGITTLTPTQKEICRLYQLPPYRLLVRCGHRVGKTHLLAALVSHHFDSFDNCGVITIAPTGQHLKDVLWREIRVQRARAGLGNLVGNVVCEMRGEDPENPKWAIGIACDRQESVAGRHPENLLVVMDEATGIPNSHVDAIRGMFDPRQGMGWICCYNPVSPDTWPYREEKSGDWHVLGMSALDHPNILAALRGEPELIRSAVGISHVKDWFKSLSEPVRVDERRPLDIEWPPGSGEWHRPTAELEFRCLGRWPTNETLGIWGQYTFECLTRPIEWDDYLACLPEVGVDCAHHGDDYTAIHWRWGPNSIGHERHNGWDQRRTTNRLQLLCAELAMMANLKRPREAHRVEPEEICARVDGDAYGSAIVEHKRDFNFVPICASGSPAIHGERYQNRRAENWFEIAKLARQGAISIADLPREHQDRLRDQLLSVRSVINEKSGKLQAEDKSEVKERLKCSPDDADAFLLAYCAPGGVASIAWQIQAQQLIQDRSSEPRQEKQPFEPRPITTKDPRHASQQHSPYYLDDEDRDDFGGGMRHWRFGYQ